MYNQDSPLSITASIAGILTLVTAILAATYARITYLRTASTEYFRVKASLSWYKTESTFLRDLITSHAPSFPPSHSFPPNPSSSSTSTPKSIEYEMYTFVTEQLQKIEERLLELLSEAEKDDGDGWTLVPRGRMEVAVRWAPVRQKALELCRQRDALGNRVLFAQISVLSSRIRDQELRARKREERDRERMERLEGLVGTQTEKLDKLEDLVYRIMHRSRVSPEEKESSEYEDYRGHSRRETDLETLDASNENAERERKSSVAANIYPVPSI